jgi:EAL domain-containing protein (putative c-di-GMP-specific phosphodiesterase class I)
VQISASIGVSAAGSGHSTERLLQEADIAMYRAKAQGKGRAVRVTRETLQAVDDRLSILSELREAAAKDELQLMLWPIGDLRDGSIRGMEATVRWHHPERGLITPADFLPLAINSGFASQIDEWVIVTATQQFADWENAGLPVSDLELAINLTAEMFVASRSRQLMTQEIHRHDLKPTNFRIEVPETVLRNETTSLKDVFDTSRAVGMPVTLDRFGSDYSNLELLPRFAIDAVKIDLHLIADLTNRLSSRALVSSLITLAQTAGLRVSAAGVDDETIRQQLLELGCNQGQGLWLSNALDADAFAELLESRHMLGMA